MAPDNSNNTAHVVVIGAGVVGLTCALLLAREPGIRVTVVAKHMPGDVDPEYASPYAGATFFPFFDGDTAQSALERRTWPELRRLADTVPGAGIHRQQANIYTRNQDLVRDKDLRRSVSGLYSPAPWFHDLVDDLRHNTRPLPPTYDTMYSFRSLCINSPQYLAWLASQCLELGVELVRATLHHVADARAFAPAGLTLVVNAAGLGARTLGGVADSTVRPASGQVVVVRNRAGGHMHVLSGVADGRADETTYIMERAGGGGTVIGGTSMLDDWDPVPDEGVAARLMERAVRLFPDLVDPAVQKGGVAAEGRLDIVRHAVGRRPHRDGGVRLEREWVRDGWVVHAYGHGGCGYQSSYGTAERVVGLVREARRELGQQVEDTAVFAW